MTEDEIISRVLGGDTRAFALLVGLHQRKALSLATRMLQNSFDAEDVVQEAFIKAFKGLAGFQGNATFATWFYRIVYRTCLNALAVQRRLPPVEQISEDLAPVWIEPEIFNTVDNSTLDQILRDELERMPPLYAVVMELFYVHNRSYEYIVGVTDMPLGTVKTRLNRGRSILRSALILRYPEFEYLNE